MALVDVGERQVTLKLVYYGPPQSGKTTNLSQLHARVDAANRGRLITLETQDDRTLFFDLLPIFFRSSKLSFRVKVYTVPGQPMHDATRRIVLQNADGIAFVADSAPEAQRENRRSFDNLRANLDRQGMSLDRMAVVTQYNKRDLDERIGEDLMRPLAGVEPVFPASALTGEGVVETFLGLVQRTWEVVDDESKIAERLGIEPSGFREATRRHLGLDDPDGVVD